MSSAAITRRQITRGLSSICIASTTALSSPRQRPPAIALATCNRRRHRHDVTHPKSSPFTDDKITVLVPPPPTWSVRELRLTASADGADTTQKISEEELATLARRCLIDVRRLSPGRREQLRTDVAGIMRCASVLLDAKHLHYNENNKMTDEEVYDAPRGLGKLPIRRDDEVERRDGDDWKERDSRESRAVLCGESVKRKMLKKDSEMFFSVLTKR